MPRQKILMEFNTEKTKFKERILSRYSELLNCIFVKNIMIFYHIIMNK